MKHHLDRRYKRKGSAQVLLVRTEETEELSRPGRRDNSKSPLGPLGDNNLTV